MKIYKVLLVIFSAALLLTTTCSSSSEASPNLITNGTASEGMRGWTDPDGLWQTSTNYDGVKEYDSYYFHPKGYRGSNGTRIYQDVNISSYRGMVATLSAQNRAYGSGNDYSMLKMEFFDSYGSLIDSASSAMDQGTSTWHLIQVSANVPQSAVTARISLYSFYRTGSEADSYFDNVSLTMNSSAAAPSPAVKGSGLIVNGTASDGMRGWIDHDGLWQTSTNYDGVKEYDSYYFHPKGYRGSNGTRIYQDVNISSYRGMVATLSAQNRAYGSGNDYSMLKMEFFDSYGNLIDSASSGMDQGTSTWHLIQVSAKVPQNAVTARISLYSFYRTGSEADSYFDNVSLTMNSSAAVPAPVVKGSGLIVNGTASDGMRGWIDPDGLWQTSTNYDGVKEYDSYYFHPKGYKGSNGTRIYQDVNISSYRGMVATLSAQNRAYGTGNDYSMLKMEFFDSYGNLIDSASSGMDQGTSTWHLIQVSAKVPQNAVTARISLYSFYRTGSEADSYFDNVSLTTDLERVELY